MNDDASAKIQMLKSSLRCFMFGLLGLLPLIGLPCGVAALWISGQTRAREKDFWNAAKPYRVWGVVCAALGLIFWCGILMIVIAHVIMSAEGLG
jgi:hypothetical protein